MSVHTLRIIPIPATCLLVGLVEILRAAVAMADPTNTICVTTADEFQKALTKTSDNGAFAGQYNVIHMAAGRYSIGTATGGGPFTYNSTAGQGLTIQGGFNADCSTMVPDANLTILDGALLSQVLRITTKTDLININFLTIERGRSTSNGAGLSINPIGTPTDDNTVVIQDTVITDNLTQGRGGGFYVVAGGNLSFLANLVVNNGAQGDFGAGVLTSPVCTVNNLTVSRNTTSINDGTGGINFDCAVSYLFDNILWGNTNYGGDFTAPGKAKLVENDYGSLKITPSMNARFQTVDPRFVDPDNSDFHLAGDSPVIGQAFSASTFDLDLEGHDNAFPGPADFGAYQTTIFSSGFDVLPPSLK